MDRSFVGLSAAVGEIRLLQAAGRNLRQLLGESDHWFVGKARGDMLQAVNLRLGSRDDARIAMADTDGDNAAEKIEVLLTFDVPDVLHGGVVHGQGVGVVGRDRREDKFLLFAIDLFPAQAGLFGGNCRSAHDGYYRTRSRARNAKPSETTIMTGVRL